MSKPLLAFIASDLKEEDVSAMRALCASLPGGWSAGPPEFVDHTDTTSGTRPEDLPVRTVGIALQVRDDDEEPKTPAEEVRRFVGYLADFSRQRALEIEFELDGNYVGELREGVPDRSLGFGLLDGW